MNFQENNQPKENTPKESTVLGIIWSDDEIIDLTVDPRVHHENFLTAQENDRYSEEDRLTNYSIQGENEVFKSLPDHVTVRKRKVRQNHSFTSKHSMANSGNEKEEDVVNIIRMLSFDDCVNSPASGITVQQCTKSEHHDCIGDECKITIECGSGKGSTQCPSRANSHFKQTEMCFRKDVKLSSSVLGNDGANHDAGLIGYEATTGPGVDRESQIREGNVSQGCFTGANGINSLQKVDAASLEIQENKWNKAKETMSSEKHVKHDQDILYDNDKSCENNSKSIICTPSSKTEVKDKTDLNEITVLLSSETDSDYDPIWENENKSVVINSKPNVEESQCNKHPIQLSNKKFGTLDLTCSVEKKSSGKPGVSVTRDRYVYLK